MDDIARREALEWTDTWWEQAHDASLPRVLLVGDSIARDYHPMVRDDLRGQAHVDRYTTSRFAMDSFFQREIGLYLHAYPYRAIHLNHGLHGQAFSLEAYAAAYERLLEQVLAACPRVVLAASTPAACKRDLMALHPQRTPRILARNEVVRSLADKYRLPYNDLYALAQERPDLKIEGDGVHFVPEGSRRLADAVTASIRKEMESRNA